MSRSQASYNCATVRSWLNSLSLKQFLHRTLETNKKRRHRELAAVMGEGRFIRAARGQGVNNGWWTHDWIGWCYETAAAYNHFFLDHRLRPNIRATWRALLIVLHRDPATIAAIRATFALTEEPFDPTPRHKLILGLWEMLEEKLEAATFIGRVRHRQELRARRLDLRSMDGFAIKDQATSRLTDQEWLAECLPPKI